MTEVNAVTTPESAETTGIRLGAGPYPYSDPTIWPDWYLAHLLAGIADPKWEALTQEQKDAVVAENKRRHPDEESQAGGPVAQPASLAASVSPLQPAKVGGVVDVTTTGTAIPAAAVTPHTRESDEAILAGTVADVSDYVSKVSNTTELDALKTAEEAGKNRTGVLDAIEKRRAVLTAAPTAPTE